MVLKRGKMASGERKVTLITLSILAVVSFLFTASSGSWQALVGWLLYWVIGVPAVQSGLWLFDVIAEAEYDPGYEDRETAGLRGAIYVTWIVSVPLLAIAAFVVSMFRLALKLID